MQKGKLILLRAKIQRAFMWKLSLILCSSCVVAANATTSGFYAGLGIGASNQILDFVPGAYGFNTNGSSLTNSTWTFDGRLDGGYKLDKFNSFELGWMYTSQAVYGLPDNSNNMNINASTIDLSYMFTVPTKIPGFSAFGRLGVAYDFINAAGGGCNCGANVMTPGGANFADILGAGIKWDLSNHITTKLEWISNGLLFPVGISSTGNNVANWSSQTFNIGLDYNF